MRESVDREWLVIDIYIAIQEIKDVCEYRLISIYWDQRI